MKTPPRHTIETLRAEMEWDFFVHHGRAVSECDKEMREKFARLFLDRALALADEWRAWTNTLHEDPP